MSKFRMNCPHCNAFVEADDSQARMQCPYCGGVIETAAKAKPIQETTIEQKADSPVVAICHDCGRGIKASEPLHRYEKIRRVRHGRIHRDESETYPLCPECYKRQTDADEAKEKARLAEIAREEEHKSHVRTFWVIFGLIVITAICCVFGYVATTMGMNFFAGFGIGFVALVIVFLVILFKALA